MARIAPFRGIRYDPEVVCLDDVTSPPYDVISAADNDYFHNRHDKNVVRLILGREMPGDCSGSDRYSRAGSYLQEWLTDGTLKQDEKPAVYVYEQRFELGEESMTVRGFVALVKLQDYSERVILPHENTLAKPKSHLAPLIRSAGANLDSVYGVYPDSDHAVDEVLDHAAAAQPAAQASDRDGVRHRLWVVDDKDEIEIIANTLADSPIVIADGHHRYETSLAYRDEMRKQEGNPAGERPYDYLMMTLVNIYSPDLMVFPTHRMVRNLSNEQLDRMQVGMPKLFEMIESRSETMLADMGSYGGRAIGVYKGGNARLAVPKEGTCSLIQGPPAMQGLDLCILHELMLDRVLGIDAEKTRQEANLVYTRDGAQAMERVDADEFQLAFFLNPINVEVILDVARAGQRMPQKATYFYPKLLSGLVMRKIV